MQQLEDSTLDLIYRRRVRTFIPGYVVIFIVLGIAILLPVVKVDVVTSSRGMIRPLLEPRELFPAISGIVDSSFIINNGLVESGDTLLWIRCDGPNSKIESLRDQIQSNKTFIKDVRLILDGEDSPLTTRFQQSIRNHRAALSHLTIQKAFIEDEYNTARILFKEDVISSHEFERARSTLRIIRAEELDLSESYRKILEEDHYRLERENSRLLDEIRLIHSSCQEYVVIAPISGTLYNCRGLTTGSVIHPSLSLGKISPLGQLVAECFLDPGKILVVKTGTRVKLRFDNQGFRSHHHLETVVDLLDREVSLINGTPAYRIRCSLKNPQINYADGSTEPVKKGMTFTANFILFRRSLAALILEKANLWINPSETVSMDEKGS